MVSARTPSVNELVKDLILVHTIQLKPIIKAHFTGRMVSRGISDEVINSVYSEKNLLKKVLKLIIIMNKSQETMVFRGYQKLICAMKLKPNK